jgi:hypothetical protein
LALRQFGGWVFNRFAFMETAAFPLNFTRILVVEWKSLLD